MKFKTGGDFTKCTLCIHFRDIQHGTPGKRSALGDEILARVDDYGAAHHEVGYTQALPFVVSRHSQEEKYHRYIALSYLKPAATFNSERSR